ncbi:MAG: LexA family transcriptional regulator [Lachnospiraceae bacterium]|nr:LexA family transcriptional regulator [Lachnospiraceae bacterium]
MYNSQEIANRIKSRTKQQGKSLKEILSTCGLGVNTVSKISNGTDILTLNFAKIADSLDCSVDYLLGRTDLPEINKSPDYSYNNIEDIKPPMVAESAINYGTSNPHTIPVLGYVAAGEPILSYENALASNISENDKVSFALIAQGDSMNPVIRNGEIIEVISQQNLETGEIGIITVNNAVTCKKFYDFDDHYELRSINPDFNTIFVPKSERTTLQIIGKVALTDTQKSRYALHKNLL